VLSSRYATASSDCKKMQEELCTFAPTDLLITKNSLAKFISVDAIPSPPPARFCAAN